MNSFSERWDKREKLPISFPTIKFESITKCKEQLRAYLPADETIDMTISEWYHEPSIYLVLVRKNKVITFYQDGMNDSHIE